VPLEGQFDHMDKKEREREREKRGEIDSKGGLLFLGFERREGGREGRRARRVLFLNCRGILWWRMMRRTRTRKGRKKR